MLLLKFLIKILFIFILTHLSKAIPLPAAVTQINPSHSQNTTQTFWIHEMLILRHLIEKCKNSSTESPFSTWQYLKRTSLDVVDDITRRQTISLWPGVKLVQSSAAKEIKNPLGINETEFWQRKDLQYLTWFDRLALSLTKMLNTHILQINLKELTESLEDNARIKGLPLTNRTESAGTARHRRHRFNMMITMMFGASALGAVLVPMGFQMLSIVSGKALLLAKMALLLASINGLKRVANTGLHYGLYHVPGEHYGHYYDRGDVHHPRNVHSLAPAALPLQAGIDI